MTDHPSTSGRDPQLSPQAVLLDPAGVVVLKISRGRRVWFFAGSVFMVVWGLGVAAANWASFTGWAGLALFGIGVAFLVVQVARPDSLTLARDSFSFVSLGRRTRFAWTDIAEFGILVLPVRGGTTKQVGIRLKTPRSALARAVTSGARGQFDTVLPDRYGLTVEDLAALMEEWRAAAAA